MTGRMMKRIIVMRTMLKKTAVIILILITAATAVSAAGTTESTRDFLDGVKYYNEENYPKAIDAFAKIAAGGIRNGKLYYNLGNAYLKNGDIGHAILWYERAAKLIPNDPDLKFNLNYALTFIKDKREEKKNSMFGVLFFWKELLSQRTVQWTGLILNMMFWLFLTGQLIRRRRQLKMVSVFFMTAVGIFILTACYDYYAAAVSSARNKEAVILPSSVSVRSGLSEASTELFVLHAGTKIRIDQEKNGYYRICFSEGKIGWIPKDKAGVVEG